MGESLETKKIDTQLVNKLGKPQIVALTNGIIRQNVTDEEKFNKLEIFSQQLTNPELNIVLNVLRDQQSELASQYEQLLY